MACSGTVVLLDSLKCAQAFQQNARDCFYGLGKDMLCRKVLPPRVDGSKVSMPAPEEWMALFIALSASARRGLNLVVDGLEECPWLDGLDVVRVAPGEDPVQAVYGRAMIRQPLARVAPRAVPISGAERPGTVIFLCGTSSAGKSTLSRALQASWPGGRLLSYGLDQVYQMVPARYLGIPLNAAEIAQGVNRPEGHLGVENIPMEPLTEPAGPRMWQRIGPVVRASASAQYATIGQLARAGYSVVSDQVLYYEDWYREAVSELEGVPTRWVKVEADSEALQAHEQTRGDRVLGVSLGLLDQMYKDVPYDVEVHSGRQTPEEEARAVLEACSASRPR